MLLDLPYLHANLSHEPIGHTVHSYHRVPSTMPIAHQLAGAPGARSGTLVIAEEQTAGRGRFARRWESPPGQSLLFSLILKPPLPFPPVETSMRAGLAVALALERHFPGLAQRVGLKWPNDLLLGTSASTAGKVAGILVEGEWRGDRLTHVVVGIGLNVNQTQDQLPSMAGESLHPVSVRSFMHRQEPLDRSPLLVTLCRSLSEQLANRGESPEIQSAWQTRLWTLGQSVNVFEAGVLVWHGLATRVAGDGALEVVNEVGEARRFLAGDVSVRPV
jgi:BirA family biotin operon repressor/biotin-[acetyl-CoA-carboxylase] ligase